MTALPEDRFWMKSIAIMMRKLSKTHLAKLREEDYEVVREVFETSGGTWEDLANGSSEGWRKLLEACKAFLKVRKRRNLPPFSEPDEESD